LGTIQLAEFNWALKLARGTEQGITLSEKDIKLASRAQQGAANSGKKQATTTDMQAQSLVG
jgi:hypothetical protein